MKTETTKTNETEDMSLEPHEELELEKSDNPVAVDHLDEDEPIQGQAFVCISFLSPEGIKNCSLRGVKCRGVFSTYDEAKRHADKLQKKDPLFNIFVGEVGKWLPWDPDPNSIDDNQYREKELNDLMMKYKEEREKTKLAEEERKQKMISDSVATTAKNKNAPKPKMTTKEKLQKQLQDRKAAAKSQTQSLTDKEHIVKQEQQKLKQTEQHIEKSTTNLQNVSNNIKQIEQLYNQLKMKKANAATTNTNTTTATTSQ